MTRVLRGLFCAGIAILLATAASARVVDTLSSAIDSNDGVTSIFEAMTDDMGQPDNISFSVSGTIFGDGSVIIGDGKSIVANGNIQLNGIQVSAANGCLIAGLTVVNCSSTGIIVNSSCTVTNCRIGTDGATAIPNNQQAFSLRGGLQVTGDNNLIGGFNPGDGNIISGNTRSGIVLSGTNAFSNTIVGNIIGLADDGLTPLPNTEHGIRLRVGAHDNTIGTSAAGNVISGNADNGIWLEGDCANNLIENNLIGLTANGNAAAGNGNDGILIGGNSDNNTVNSNSIAANTANGIALVGSDATIHPDANAIVNNIIGLAKNGVAIGNGGDGVRLDSYCSNNEIGKQAQGNLLSGNQGNGIRIQNGTSNSILGNYIGTDIDGQDQRPNAKDGVLILFTSPGNQIGAAVTGAGNVISGNDGNGIRLSGNAVTGTSIVSNIIGLTANADQPLGNGLDGVLLESSATTNSVGGDQIASTFPNYIGGNGNAGIHLTGPGTHANDIASNLIGLNPAGTPLPNTVAGVLIDAGAYQNNIGSLLSDSRNVISGNDGPGILIDDSDENMVQANFIGTNLDGTAAVPNTTGISLENTATANHIGDSDAAGGNLISGNLTSGILLTDFGTSSNEIVNNAVGLAADRETALGNQGNGIVLAANALYNTVGDGTPAGRNIVSGNALDGIRVDGAANNTISGNYVGTNGNGDTAVANGSSGIIVRGAATLVYVGGLDPGEGNLVSGNTLDGIVISGVGTDSNFAQGNLVGLDATGSSAVPNGGDGIAVVLGPTSATVENNIVSGNAGDGIGVHDSFTNNTRLRGNTVGLGSDGATIVSNQGDGIDVTAAITYVGDTPGGNTISGNAANGLHVSGADALNALVVNNLIGTDAAGAIAKGNGEYGIFIEQGVINCTIGQTGAGLGNLISGNGLGGIGILGSRQCNVVNALIGTDITGTLAIANNGGGIELTGGATYNIIGSTAVNGYNIISGNTGPGVFLSGKTTTANRVIGCDIGIDLNGALLSNGGDGVIIQDAPANEIGGPANHEFNIIGGNSNGIRVTGDFAMGNTVRGNFIGVTAPLAAVPNLSHGIFFTNFATNNLVGGSDPGEANVISANGGDGIRVNGSDTFANTFAQNSIYANNGKGIRLVDGNHLYAAPVILKASPNVAGTAPPNATVELFVDFGDEGGTYLGTAQANSLGNWSIFVNLAAYIGANLTATATSPVTKSLPTGADTSEFSAPFPIECDPPTITCPADITVNANPGVSSATVTVPAPVVTPGILCAAVITGTVNDSNSTANASGTYPIGTTTVNWLATDANGKTAACAMTVTVLPASGEGEGEGASEGEGEGAAEGEGEGEGEGQPMGDLACDATSLSGQTPGSVDVSAPSSRNAAFITLESFSALAGDVGGLRVWGTLRDSQGNACVNPVFRFHISFYAAGSTPGTLVSEFDVTPEHLLTGRTANGAPEYELTASFVQPYVHSEGWFSVEIPISSDCIFYWTSSDTGDGSSGRLATGTNQFSSDTIDLAYCLLPVGETGVQSADQNADHIISLSELLRVIQFFNSLAYHCADHPNDTEDGYAPGTGTNQDCQPYDTDYNPQDWSISLSELLRVIQFYNSGGYRFCPADNTEDAFCPGL